jgi:hypothetical protein
VPLWENPIYRFRVPVDNSNPVELKEVVVDVTGSAPPFKEPSPNLKLVFDDLFSSQNNFGITSIIEFGAAKLKNVPYLLRLGKIVAAVEFETLAENEFTKANLEECRKSPNFQELIYPNPFLADDKEFDLAILANVLPVMPVPAERLYVLKTLYDKIKMGKYLLWIAQKEGAYKKIRESGNNDLGDGIWMGKGRKFKTFYRYHSLDELDELMALFGFEPVKKYSMSDDAKLYKKIKHAIMNDLLNETSIEDHIPNDTTIEDPISGALKIVKNDGTAQLVNPNPDPLAIERLYAQMLDLLIPGTSDAEIYHRLVSNALSRIFRGSLRNMNIKVEINGGTKIIDTVFTNCATKGFFNSLRNRVECTYPIVEVKNYSEDPANPEIDQLNGRLNRVRGNFGMLICRSISDEEAVFGRCRSCGSERIILPITDADIREMLTYSANEDDQSIDDLMDSKLQKFLF